MTGREAVEEFVKALEDSIEVQADYVYLDYWLTYKAQDRMSDDAITAIRGQMIDEVDCEWAVAEICKLCARSIRDSLGWPEPGDKPT